MTNPAPATAPATNPRPAYIVFVGMDGFDVLVETDTIREVSRLPAVLPTDHRTGHPERTIVRTDKASHITDLPVAYFEALLGAAVRPGTWALRVVAPPEALRLAAATRIAQGHFDVAVARATLGDFVNNDPFRVADCARLLTRALEAEAAYWGGL